MNIARAANRVAFLLMVFGLVALVACQQTTPTTGPKGEPGPPGPAGPPGPTVLAALGDAAEPHDIIINNVAAADGGEDAPLDKVGDLAGASLDVSTLFTGGTPPITYTEGRVTPSTGTVFELKLDGRMLTVTQSDADAKEPSPEANDYGTGARVTITATDANRVAARKTVAVKANRAPRIRTGAVADATASTQVAASGLPVGISELNYVLGTQQEIPAAASPSVAKKQAWNTGTTKGGSWAFGVQDESGAGDTAFAFVDEDHEDVTVSVGKISRDGHVEVTIDDDKHLSFTGLKSTWRDADADATPPVTAGHNPVTVELVATDKGGLDVKLTVWVWVDGAPAPTTNQAYPTTWTVKAGETKTFTNPGAFFLDPEGKDIASPPHVQAVSDVTSSAPALASAALDGSDPENITLGGLVQGRSTVRFLYGAADPYTPMDHASIVAGPLDRNGDGDIDADDGDSGATVPGELPGGQYAVGEITVVVTP